MTKYWGKQIFAHGSFPKVGQKQKMEKETKKDRLNNGNNNGQAMHGARKYAWRTQAAWANSGSKSFQEKIYFSYGILRLILMYTFKARTIKLLIYKD